LGEGRWGGLGGGGGGGGGWERGICLIRTAVRRKFVCRLRPTKLEWNYVVVSVGDKII